MDPFAATDKVLRIPELLTSVLRCLGPLSWLKCASVCSVWSDAILTHDGDKGEAGARTACRARARKTPATKRAVAATTTAAEAAISVAVSASTENRAAAAAAAPPPGAKAEPSPASERSAAIGGEEGDGRTVVAAAVAADLWREFAVTVIRYRDESTARGARQKASSSGGGGGGGGVGARGGSSFYRHVCIEGDPTVLGPPLRAMAAVSGGNSSRPRGVTVATVSLADVIAASEARYRRPRALIKFLSLWSRYQHYGTTTPALTVEVNHDAMLIAYSSPSASRRQKGGGGGGGARGRDRRGCGASFAKAAPAQPVLSSSSNSSASSSKKKSKPLSPACCAVTTAKLSDALGVFTKLLVLCRRCRRPCTTLYATQGGVSGGG
ncbi:unnamed protein product, partial [Scytosiphon promiscuus]